MTSKHCLINVMREDFRHKTWMLALSVLGNLLALPVCYQLMTSGRYATLEEPDKMMRQMAAISNFFRSQMMIGCGVIAIAGALIVGLFGFWYVHHKNMVDTWHSMPVKRRTLFTAGWLNGFLIWLVPFAIMMVITTVMGVLKFADNRNELLSSGVLNSYQELATELNEMGTTAELLGSIAGSVGILILAFCLVYNLSLVAVMLCGNILNTLVVTVVFGVGAVGLYTLITALCACYLDTFWTISARWMENVVYASPLVSSIYMLYTKTVVAMESTPVRLFVPVIVNLVIAVALFFAAEEIYRRRKSELAEQGIKNQPVRYGIQIVVTMVASVGGWILFALVACDLFGSNSDLGWGIFGAALCGMIAFGIMDIVFQMDFKAFFSHKLLMVLCVASGIAVGLCFSFDWFGYDVYLPDKEEIEAISIYNYNCNNYEYQEATEKSLDRMWIRDADLAYQFLETAVAFEKGRSREDRYVDMIDSVTGYGYNYQRAESVQTKVKLKNGKCYYRRYTVWSDDCEDFYKLIATPEYRRLHYQILEEHLKEMDQFIITRDAEEMEDVELFANADAKSFVRELADAYNRDLEEHTEVILKGEGRVLCEIRLTNWNRDQYRFLTVYEEMEHTIDVLEKHGYERYVRLPKASEIAKIYLRTYCWYSEEQLQTENDYIWLAAEHYGVYPKELYEETKTDTSEWNAKLVTYYRGENPEIMICITDPEEIRELLEFISYTYNSCYLFQNGDTDGIELEYVDGSRYGCMIPVGVLPEQYILRFGKLAYGVPEE